MLLSAIARVLGATLPSAAEDREITGIASPECAGERSVTFLAKKSFRLAVESSRCAAVIVRRGEKVDGKICIEIDDPYVGYAKIAQAFEDARPFWKEGVAPSAFVDPTARIGASSSVGPFSAIGADVRIGESSRIGAHCVIERGSIIGDHCRIDAGAVIRWDSIIGNRVIIQSGAVVGSDGFGNAREASGRFIRIPCFGAVVIEDDVDIGACATIDRGNFEPTVLRRGVKLDNMVHIAHNVTVGDDTAIAAQTGVSGSTRIGKRVLIGGQAGFVGHIEIGDDAFVGAKAGVAKGVGAGERVTGYPARDFMDVRRMEAAQMQLPELLKEVRRLRKEIEELKNIQSRPAALPSGSGGAYTI